MQIKGIKLKVKANIERIDKSPYGRPRKRCIISIHDEWRRRSMLKSILEKQEVREEELIGM